MREYAGKNRVYGIDILRCIAIIGVMFFHLPMFTKSEFKFFGRDNLSDFVLLIFFIISGFLMSYKTTLPLKESKKFVFKRFIRILPLYWLSLFLSWLLASFGLLYLDRPYDTSLDNLFGNALGLQAFSDSLYCPGMWFMGVLIFLYVFFIALAALSSNTNKFNLYSLIVFLLLVFSSRFFPSVPIIVCWYPVFFMGMVVGYAVKSKTDGGDLVYPVIFLMLLLLITAIFPEMVRYIKSDFLIAMTIVFSVLLFILGRSSKSPKRDSFQDYLVSRLAYSSYAIYLFHLPILGVINLLLEYCLPQYRLIGLLLAIFFLVFPLSYSVQRGYDRLLGLKQKF